MLERFIMLEKNVDQLNSFKAKHSLDDVVEDRSLEWALRYGFLESIQIIIDISCHLTSKYNLGSPESYGECIDLLNKYEYVSNSLSVKLKSMVGLRNILIHEYVKVDMEMLYGLLDNLSDVNGFVKAVREYL